MCGSIVWYLTVVKVLLISYVDNDNIHRPTIQTFVELFTFGFIYAITLFNYLSKIFLILRFLNSQEFITFC